MSRATRAYLFLCLIAFAVYFTMVLWSLPKIAASAGGLLPFDLRPGGYTLDDARAFLAALDVETVRFYLTVQHLLDGIYPPLLALVLGVALWRLLARAPGWLRIAALAPPILGMIFDWLENVRVAGLLRAGALGITEQTVAAASHATILKSVFTSLAMLAICAALLLRGWRWMRRRGKAGG